MKLHKAKLITCILPKGSGAPMLRRLRREKSVTTASLSFCRGAGMGKAANAPATEKEVITVVVSSEVADDLFGFMYFEGGLDKPHGGFLYMTTLIGSVPYSLPQLPEEQV